jgi:hypothetical protein
MYWSFLLRSRPRPYLNRLTSSSTFFYYMMLPMKNYLTSFLFASGNYRYFELKSSHSFYTVSMLRTAGLFCLLMRYFRTYLTCCYSGL